MAWPDLTILAIVAVSMLISVIRGFVREALSLLSWMLAGTIAMTFAPKLAVFLESTITVASLRMAVAFAVLFLAVLVLASIMSFLITRTLKKSGFSGMDRFMGSLFGLARGVLIVAIIVFLGTLTPFAQDSWWQESRLIVYFEDLAKWLTTFLPEDLSAKAAALQ